MADLAELADKIKYISSEIQKSPRVDAEDGSKTGWGQFVDAPSHIHQIGPYGTSAALLIQSFAHREAPAPSSAVKQLQAFWDEPQESNKLFTQNVRAAFLVLALAEVTDQSLISLRDKVVNELRRRQRKDGGWPDGVAEGTVHPTSRAEPTAWVILALHRASPGDPAAVDGALFIQSQVTERLNSGLVSPIAAAAALKVLPIKKHTAKLRRQATEILRTAEAGQEEYISFFDYSETKNGVSRMSRDYLCFPAFYPSALLIAGLMKTRNPITRFRLGVRRSRVLEHLLQIIPDNSLYRLPGAPFSATVDQALIALSYENLAVSRTYMDPLTRIARPIFSWVSNSLLFKVIFPLFVLTFAIATLADPGTVPQVIGKTFGTDVTSINVFVSENASAIRIGVAFLLAIVPSMPASAWGYFKKKFEP